MVTLLLLLQTSDLEGQTLNTAFLKLFLLSQRTVSTNPQFLKGHGTDWQAVDLDVENAKGCPKRQELKQEKFFEFCLGRLETIFYAVFPLCSAGV